jgi:hypothetical protein
LKRIENLLCTSGIDIENVGEGLDEKFGSFALVLMRDENFRKVLKGDGQLVKSCFRNLVKFIFDEGEDLFIVDSGVDNFGERSNASPDELLNHGITLLSLFGVLGLAAHSSSVLKEREEVGIEDGHLVSSIGLLDDGQQPKIVLLFEGFISNVSVEIQRI